MANHLLDAMEWAMSPAQFDRAWPPPTKDGNVWRYNPAGYTFGYGVALTQDAAEWGRQHIRASARDAVAEIPWC